MGPEAVVDETPVVICYDGCAESRQAIADAAAMLSERRAVVVNVAQLDAVAEVYAAAKLARHAGFRAEGRGTLATPLWRGVVEVADEVDASVIVVGGHMSRHVLEHARRALLVIPAR